MKITIELDNGQQQTVDIPINNKELIIGSLRSQLGSLEATMRGYLAETTEREKKLLSNFIRGKLTAYQEINKILSTL
jgi:hypothetical protein